MKTVGEVTYQNLLMNLLCWSFPIVKRVGGPRAGGVRLPDEWGLELCDDDRLRGRFGDFCFLDAIFEVCDKCADARGNR